ncbi:MAG TPA: sigma 54-interacting transcriptional regulator [Candidatus Krumholzibacteria bacterium]|nr:sigma 54-interacting transcriptional regulator [Candidatus Krumholzibacteria bacterium]
MATQPSMQTRGALVQAGIQVLAVKEELRRNLIRRKREGKPVFTGLVGYEHTVIPQIENALFSKHDFLLLGLRGQAKTRLLRQLTGLLDEWSPAVAGCQINDDPYAPLCKRCRRVAVEAGDDLPIVWLHRDERYHEKLATPDVTIADLIGDIDPIKAARDRLTFADEEVVHFGLVPRTHRGIFALNELPDLQPRIQVGLLDIMEEKDFQIRGFPVRLRIDILMVFAANPEDYTNRGNIITPLKDRIASQILTHYPQSVQDAIRITDQEAWTERGSDCRIPDYFRVIVEQVAFEARKSEFVDQSSGVSARVSIAAYENLWSNMERRGLETGESPVYARIADLHAIVPALSGKIELVYEGEQQGPDAVARHLVGQAVKSVFAQHFPPVAPQGKGRRSPKSGDEPQDAALDVPSGESRSTASTGRETGGASRHSAYDRVVGWFSGGKRIEISDQMRQADYAAALRQVDGLEEVARRCLPQADEGALPGVMELILEGLYQNSFVAKETVERSTFYSDMLLRMFDRMRSE